MLKLVPKIAFTYFLRDYFIRFKILLPFVGYPLNRKEGFRPIYIVGSGRSGTTLLRRILVSEQSVHIPPEVFVTKTCIELFSRFRSLPWGTLVRLILAQFEYSHVDADKWARRPEQSYSFDVPLREVVTKLEKMPAGKRSLAAIFNETYLYHAQQKGYRGKRWGDKTPWNVFALHDILRVFPDAQFINTIRDGCDVAASFIKSGRYADIEAAGNRWVQSLRAAETFSRRHPGKVLDVRYEELVVDPEKEVKRVCRFLGIKFNPSMLLSEKGAKEMGDVPIYEHHKNVSKPISAHSIGKGRRSLTRIQKQCLEKIIGEHLKSLGYPPCFNSPN